MPREGGRGGVYHRQCREKGGGVHVSPEGGGVHVSPSETNPKGNELPYDGTSINVQRF